MTGLDGRTILLIISGGVAAYKGLETIRVLKRRGARVIPVLTPGAEAFVTPLSAAALAGERAHTALLDLTAEAEMGHIALSRAADLIVIAPATADLTARMAQGRADDLASTLLLATDTRILVAPSMNVRMWLHPATRRNVETLRADGVRFVGPEVGDMACGEHGPGRMSEPEAIADAAEAMLEAGSAKIALSGEGSGARPLIGRTALVTSGPTHEPIDPVRYLANRSSGRQGHAIAQALAEAGADVTLVSGPVSIPDPAGVRMVRVATAEEMLDAARAALPADVAVFTAAVADWRVEASASKIKKTGAAAPALALTRNPDVLATIAKGAPRPELVIGFAAETDDVDAHARAKLEAKGADLIVANDVSLRTDGTGVMGGARNAVTLHAAGEAPEVWPEMDKTEVARRLVERIAERMAERMTKRLR